jgi:hypothetical protein
MPASSSTSTYSPDKLIAGPTIRHSKKRTLLSGEGALARGTLLGAVTVGAAAAVAYAGNTGNGVFGAVTTSPTPSPAFTTSSSSSRQRTSARSSSKIPTVTSSAAATSPPPSRAQIGFTIADGATDFISGDGFTVTVAAGSGKMRKCVAANTDGSQRPVEILADAADSTAADVECETYTTGDFNPNAITFGAGVTAANSEAALRALGIFFITAQL